MEVTVIDSDTVNSDSTIDLIQVLDQKYANASEIVLILDNARYHYSKEVKKALEEHGRVRLVFLPPYSPNLNLIERLWRFFKKNVLYNKFHNTKEAFRRACIDFFQQLKDRKSELQSLMGGGFEI
jgi:transposase